MKPWNLIKKKIVQSSSFVVVTHISPEADAIGSQLAMYRLLRNWNKKVKLVLDDKIPSNLKFFPDIKKIIRLSGYKLNPADYDTLIVLDTPSVSRLGKLGKLITEFNLVINIDHHVSNTRYGDIVWVEEDRSSTGEMLYELYKIFGVRLDYKSALYIYSAIMTDSGCFKYAGTSSRTHKIVANLLELGINPYWVYSQIYEKNTLNKIRILGACLESVHKDNGIVWVEITKKMLKKYKARHEDLEGIIDFLRTIQEADVAVVFQEVRDGIKITFRSRNQYIDVNKIAKYFGGGGHKMASGCKLTGNLSDVRKMVIKVIKECINKK
ncbi:MAG TPA: bifunctional oligoribonuclease/PAP phosphatase NrnA [Candidatus Omnitrophica bacterium]|nr:bifunctional oligoribonuclease/PAP phosphatase NrnA [Candidatus Omnitrophota bacterium]